MVHTWPKFKQSLNFGPQHGTSGGHCIRGRVGSAQPGWLAVPARQKAGPANRQSTSKLGLDEIEGQKQALSAQSCSKMVYIVNKNIPQNKRIKNALTSIFGVGEKRALEICHSLCINPNLRFNKVFRTPTQIAHGASRISALLRGAPGGIDPKGDPLGQVARRDFEVGSSLQKKINEDVKLLTKIRCYRGLRHKNRLPVRGQRTHTNAQTQKKMKRINQLS